MFYAISEGCRNKIIARTWKEINFTLIIKFLYILEKNVPVYHGHVDGVCNK